MTRTPPPRRRPHAIPAAVALLLVGLALVPGTARPADPAPEAPRHVVLLVVGGGVRATDLLDGARMASVKALAAQGVAVDGIASARGNAWLAARDLVTGRTDEPDAQGRPQPSHPTLFERLRAVPGVTAEEVWLVSPTGGDDLRLAASSDPAFGPSLGARTAYGAGAFGEPLKDFLDDLGRPLPVADAVWPLLRRLRVLNRSAAGVFLPEDVDAGTPEAERVERAVLLELDRRSTLVRGPSPGDQRALRAALTLLAVHRPRLLVVRLTGAEAGQQSVQAYADALRVADEGLARLRAAVAADPQLATTTTIVVTTDTGRNAKPNARGGLDADEDSPERRTAALVMAGPGVKKGGRVKGARTLADVAPTLARLLQAPMPDVTGRAWEEVLRLP